MKFLSILTSVVCVAALSACASTPPAEPVARVTTMKAAMAEANAAALSGHPDKAYALMKQAGATWPADKTPWVRMAQMRFDTNNYGDAIVNALEALHRDPDDTVANSVVAVSGLRLSSKALADLTRKNNLSGTVRTEAQDLAKLLRNSLNEEILIPQTARPPVRSTAKPRSSAATASASVPAATTAKSGGADPFGALK
jgi:cytochrome c556